MAIKRNFQGVTLRKPGAYSSTKTASNGAGATSTTGVMFVIGEADAGPGGAAEGIQLYSAAAVNQLIAKYVSGPIVDCVKVALAPSRTPGINGASAFLVYKTNSSVPASYALANTYAAITAEEYGVGGNRITYKNVVSSEAEVSVTGSAPVTVAGLNGLTLKVAQNGGAVSTVTFVTPADMAAVVSQINAALTGVIASGAATLKLTQTAVSNHHRDGFGRSFEVLASSTALTLLAMASGLVVPASEPQASFEILQPRDSIAQTGVVGGVISMSIGRDASGSCTAANVVVSGTSLTLNQTGATPSSVVFAFSDYPTIGNLVDGLNAVPGCACAVSSSIRGNASNSLDQVTVGAFSAAGLKPARIKSDVKAVKDFFDAATLASIVVSAVKGLPDAEGRVNLVGGVRGASASSAFDAGLAASLAQDFNVVVPAISQDASVDVLAGLTDVASTYDIETIHAMVSAHLVLRGNIQNKKEAQGVVGYRKNTKAAAFAQAALLGDSNVQMCMEDVLVVDSSRELRWNQPHVMAALIAGMRCGSSIGEPLTHKYLAVSGVGHFVNTATGIASGDYNSLTDYDSAIDAGVTSAEPANGAFRVMVDNTTYGADGSFLYNRGSVVEASQYIAKTIRADAETAFVGRKTAAVSAESIKSRIRGRLIEMFNAQITATSVDAPQGFVESSFVVTIVGNTATVEVEAKPTQALDFLLINFTMGDATTSA